MTPAKMPTTQPTTTMNVTPAMRQESGVHPRRRTGYHGILLLAAGEVDATGDRNCQAVIVRQADTDALDVQFAGAARAPLR
jgi:hypothetical protein